MRVLTIILLCVALAAISCTKRSRVSERCESGCKPNRACTNEFRTAAVHVVNNAGTHVTLDSFVVVRLYDNKLIINNPSLQSIGLLPNAGRYLLFSDSEMNETSRCGEEFEFRGFKGNQRVATRVYKIAHDCCHFNMVSGETKIVIAD